MRDRGWLGTRKGLFRLQKNTGGWEIADVAFRGHPVSYVFVDPRDGAIYAALNLGHFGAKLHRSDDDGATWTEVAVPVFPEGEGAPTLKQIWSMEAAGPNVEDGLWLGTIPGGLFQSRDRGASWQLNEPLWNHPSRAKWFGGGADDPAIHSICVDPRNPQHVRIAVSCGGVWRTFDGGQTWAIGGIGMRADFMPPDEQMNPEIQDPHLMVQCPADPDTLWVQHHNGIFRSTDGADSWEEVTGLDVSLFGFAVAVHPANPLRAWFIPAIKDEMRIPVDGRLVVTRTDDGGKTGTVLTNGLPAENCYDLVFRHALAIDETGDQLLFGSTTGNAYATENGGDTWTALPWHLPPVYVAKLA